tara:strand:- start:393 stop:536 length:144 start_codon:yes stop_codon:yes gene_type:complete
MICAVAPNINAILLQHQNTIRQHEAHIKTVFDNQKRLRENIKSLEKV